MGKVSEQGRRPIQDRLTSLLLCELPANALRKFACGSSMCVRPERTTQPSRAARSAAAPRPSKHENGGGTHR